MPGTIPTPTKSYEFVQNKPTTWTFGGPTDPTMYDIKTVLVGFSNVPCVVKGSSDKTTAAMDGTDRWTASSKVSFATAGTAHSWIVLEFPGIVDSSGHKLQVCIDCNSGGNSANCSFIASPVAGFTGGSTTARPTATDEQVVQSALAWGGIGSGTTSAGKIHAIHSTDGKVTHILACRNNVVAAWWCFAQPTATIDVEPSAGGWNYPWLVWIEATSTNAAASVMTTANIISTQAKHAARHLATALSMQMQVEGGSAVFGGGPADSANGITGQYIMLPSGLWSGTVGTVGRLGYVPDLLFISPTIFGSIGATIGADDSHRRWACCGCLALPWSNDAVVPLGS